MRDREGEGEARYLQRGLRRCADEERRGEKRKRREERGFTNSKTQKLNNKKLPGCAAGGALAASGGIKAAGFGCVSFAAFSAFIEKVMQHD